MLRVMQMGIGLDGRQAAFQYVSAGAGATGVDRSARLPPSVDEHSESALAAKTVQEQPRYCWMVCIAFGRTCSF